MRERVTAVILSVRQSVCLSRSDFGDYWQLTVDLRRYELTQNEDLGHFIVQLFLISG